MLTNYFKEDFKRIFNKNFFFAVFIGVCIIFLAMYINPIKSGLNLIKSDSSDITKEELNHLIKNSFNYTTLWYFGNTLFTMCIPIIVTIPFATTYIQDKNNKYDLIVLSRMNKEYYLKTKIINTFISGFLVILIIQIINIIMILLIGNNEARSLFFEGGIKSLNNILNEKFWLFLIFYILILSIVGGVYAILTFAISKVIKKLPLVLITPFIVVILSSIFSKLNYNFLDLNNLTNFYLNESSRYLTLFFQIILIIYISLSIIFLKYKRRFL